MSKKSPVAASSDVDGHVGAPWTSAHRIWPNVRVNTARAVIMKVTTGNPATAAEGDVCINTFDNNVKIYADAGWRQIATW